MVHADAWFGDKLHSLITEGMIEKEEDLERSTSAK